MALNGGLMADPPAAAAPAGSTDRTLEAIYGLGQELVLTRDESTIAHAVVSAARQLLHFQICSLSMVRGTELVIVAHEGYDQDFEGLALALSGGSGITVAVAKSGMPLNVEDVNRDARYVPSGGFKARSELAVPIRIDQQVLGVLNVESDRPADFTPIDQRALSTLADVAAVALESARVYHGMQRRAAEMTALYHLGIALVNEQDPAAIADRIFTELGELLGVKTAILDILDRETNTLVGYGVDQGEAIELPPIPLRQGSLSGHVVETGQALLVSDVSAADLPVPGVLVGALPASWLGVPLRIGEQSVGCLSIQSYSPGAFDRAHEQLLHQIAAQVAPILDNARLYRLQRLKADEMAALNRIARGLVQGLTFQQLLESMVPELRQLAACDRVSIALADNADQPSTFTIYALNDGAGRVLKTGTTLSVAETAAASDLQQGLAHVTGDLAAESGFPVEHALYEAGFRSRVNLPLVSRGRVIGALNLDSLKPHLYSEGQIPLLQQVADMAASVAENAQLVQRLRDQAGQLERRVAHRTAELQTLYGLALCLAPVLGYGQLAETVLGALAEAIRPGLGACLLAPESRPPSLSMQLNRPAGPALEKLIGQLVARKLHEAKGPLVDSESVEYHDISARVSADQGPPLDALPQWSCFAPIAVSGKVVGILAAFSDGTTDFTAGQRRFLSGLAQEAANAVARIDQVEMSTRALRQERDTTRAILDSAADGIVVTDLDGTIEYVNPVAQELTGYAAQVAIGQNPRLWSSGMQPESFYSEMWQNILAGHTWEGEVVNRHRGGALYDVMLRIAPIPGPLGSPVGFVGVQTDISQLKELDRMKDQFVSNVSHELRTPLTNLKLYLNLLEKGRPDKRNQYMTTLHREANRLSQTIEDLLSLSRLDVGTIEMNRAPTDLNRIIHQLVADRATLALERGIELRENLSDRLPLALIDPRLLLQVITNLMTNAMHYTPPGGVITIGTLVLRDGGREWSVVTVEDTGLGIPPGELEHIFDRFYRGSAAELTGASGTGLGLAISQEIVQRHGGRITVDSEPSVGSKFCVWLPLDS